MVCIHYFIFDILFLLYSSPGSNRACRHKSPNLTVASFTYNKAGPLTKTKPLHRRFKLLLGA